MNAIIYISTRLKSSPRLWGAIVRAGTRVGASPQNLLLLETVSRPWWLYRSKGRLALHTVRRRTATPPTEADVALCERLILAFAAVTSSRPEDWQAQGVWAHLLDMHYRPLAQALERRDPHDLARLLASLFQQKFANGFMVQAHTSNTASWLGSRILGLASLDVLVSLAEALGAIPPDGPEMRRSGFIFDGDVAEVLRRIDRVLGFRLDFPDIGAPFGVVADGRMITLETPEQIYASVRLGQAIDAHLQRPSDAPLRIVEIGGGYGGMCYWFLRTRPDTTEYTIIDLPIVNVIQGYFLSRALGREAVSLYGEPAAQVKILPNSALAEIRTPFDVLVNKDSMPEMPHETMVSYLEWGRASCDGLFYSYNTEACVEFLGQTEGRVPDAIELVGGFNRVRRDQSWMRRGYVEEIYVPVGALSE